MIPWNLVIAQLTSNGMVENTQAGPEKTCPGCNQSKPVSQFYLMGGRVSHVCKACHKTRAYANRAKP